MKQKLILDGITVANKIKTNLQIKIEGLLKKGITPCLATILVGDDASSETYVRMKGNACSKIGMESRKIHLSKETSTSDLLKVIQELNKDESVHGILLQHPVPSQIDERAAFDAIAINKRRRGH